MSTTDPTETAIARRVSKGHNAVESRDLLADLLRTISPGSNLAHALTYNAFATDRTADRLAAALTA
jgi:hypothetical protein